MSFPTPQASSSTTFTPPPLDGSLSLPEIYDYHRVHNPKHPIFRYEDSENVVRTIRWGKAVEAVHTAARLVESTLRRVHVGEKSTVIAILANADPFTYFVLLAGIIRAGYQAFPISTRNSPAGVAHLVQKTRSKYLFVSKDRAMQTLARAACAHPSIGGSVGSLLDVQPMPTFESLFSGSTDNFVPLPPMEHPDEDTPALILHSSGSTAFPKPVMLTHRTLLQWGLLPYYGETDLCGQILSFHSIPLFHAMGAIQLAWTMTAGLVIAGFGPGDPSVAPTSDRVLAGAVATGSTIIFCVPSFVEAWSRDPECSHALKSFHAVIFAGATLRKEIGDKLMQAGVPLVPFYGTTEIGCVTVFISSSPGKDGWEYFKFSPHCKPVLIPHKGQENVFHLLMQDCPTNTPNVVNTEINGAKAYDTNDLLIRHPTNPDLWKVYGRVDDQIVHSTGEKTNPLPIETILLKNPMIAAGVMFGRGRFHAGLLIEPTPAYTFDTTCLEHLAKYRNAIWHTIEEANEISPAHSRIFKEMILVARASKPFEYTAKGTPMRHTVLNQYEEEIEDAYAAVEKSSQTDLTVPEAWEPDECLNFARMAVTRVIRCSLEDDDDIFLSGCDSLQATWIRNTLLHALRRSLKMSTRNIPHNFVYLNPTIRRLGAYLAQIAHYGQASVALAMLSGKIAEMERLVKKYSTGFPSHRSSTNCKCHSGEVILLTGSTGALGSYILEHLVHDPSVSRIYALNRKGSKGGQCLRERQAATFRERASDLHVLDSEKLVLLEGDAALQDFGLGVDMFHEVQKSVTCVIHNAWRVDFNLALASMEPLILGTRRLVDFALGSPHATPPRFVFASSLSVFQNWTEGLVAPESYNPRPATAIGSGYSESKWVAESVLVKASEQTPLRPVIIRIGQVCGGRNGSWNPAEWLPTLVRSGQVLRCLPRPLGYISWMPADVVAAALVEMRRSNDMFLNLTHPNPVPSSCIFEPLARALGVPLVPYCEWLVALEASTHDNSDSAVAAAIRNPALVLVDFYRSAYKPLSSLGSEAFGFPSVSTSRAMEAAPLLRTILHQLTRADVDSWVCYWRKVGFLAQ